MKTRNDQMYLLCTIIAVMLPLICYLLTNDMGIALSDPGFLWTGARFTADGAMPIRDFQAYDPARYYFCAFIMKFLGKGMDAVYLAMAIVQAASILIALKFLKKYLHFGIAVLLFALAQIMWFAPFHKSFDIGMSAFSVYFAGRLLTNNVRKEYLVSGIFTGIAAFIGRNHGVYNVLIFSLLSVFLLCRDGKAGVLRKGGMFVGGVAIGYSPILLMILTDFGFAKEFIKGIVTLISTQTTNIPLPIPFPWTVDIKGLPMYWAVNRYVIAFLFLIMPLIYLAAAILPLVRKETNSLFSEQQKSDILSCGVVGLVYTHYAFSRADIGHLAHSIMPLLMLVPVLFGGRKHQKTYRWVNSLLLGLLIMSYCAIGKYTLFYGKMIDGYQSHYFATSNSDKGLYYDPTSAIMLTSIKEKLDANGVEDRQVLFAPDLPGLYSIYDLNSPVYFSYFLFPATDMQQMAMIDNIKKNGLKMLVFRGSLTNTEGEWSFGRSFPLLTEYLVENFALAEHDETGICEIWLQKN